MNDRILELAVQAELYVDWNGRPYPRAMSSEECRAAYAKFAELLLQECIDLANHSNVTGVSVIGERIKEHFGIEE